MVYLRPAHAEVNIPTLRKFIRANPFGVLTTALSSPNYPLLQSTHIPFLLDLEDESSETELGTLRGHMARANPHSKALMEALTPSTEGETDAENKKSKNGFLEQDVMVLFTHPTYHYITPKFYTTTKPATGKVVPTWNYATAQVYGTAKIYFDTSDASTHAYLTKAVADLSMHAETNVMGFEKPWTVDEAPASYVELLKKAIIGIEITVKQLTGKFKMSQELADGDREGVLKGLNGLGTEVAKDMAEIVEERAKLKAQEKEKK